MPKPTLIVRVLRGYAISRDLDKTARELNLTPWHVRSILRKHWKSKRSVLCAEMAARNNKSRSSLQWPLSEIRWFKKMCACGFTPAEARAEIEKARQKTQMTVSEPGA